MTIADYLKSSKYNPAEFFAKTLAQAKEKNKENPAVLRREDKYIESCQESAFSKPLQGLPVIIKDNMLLEGTISGSGSKMMEGYVAPYTATVVKKLEQAGAIIIGKATMDEFAMGTTGENSPYPIPHNPLAKDRVAGGSSSGSSVSVAEKMVPVSLGTDTGGSVRAPASFCNIVSLKATYGAVSRYGVQSMASSFDQVGPMAQSVDDVETIFDIIKGKDPLDATTTDYIAKETNITVKGLRIGLPKQYFSDSLDERIQDRIMDTVKKLTEQGAEIVELDIPLLEQSVAVYYTLVPAEVSSNLARFDGLKFGYQEDTFQHGSHHDYIGEMRKKGFGAEVKRRILLGAHVLSSDEYEGQYLKAMNIRTSITKTIKEHFNKDIDIIIGPTFPLLPWKLGEKINDPLAMYLADMYTVNANITGMPAMSVPVGFVQEDNQNLPVGIQIMADHRDEKTLFTIGKEIEKITKIIC